jgi:hypothetical protein
LIALTELLQDLVLGGLAVAFSLDSLAVEDSRNLVNAGRRDGALFRVSDEELDVEMAMRHGILIIRQSHSLHSLELLMI